MFLSTKFHPPGGGPDASTLFRWFFGHSRRVFARERHPAEAVSRAFVGGAVDALDRALDSDPDSAQAHAQMGALCERRGQIHAAYRWYRQALSLDPGCTIALGGIGRYCRLMGLDYGNPRLNPAAGGRDGDA